MLERVPMRCLIALLALAVPLCAQPRRIVSTAPSITETLFALGLGDRVVGVSRHCHFPPQAATRTKVGTYVKPNVEAILALRPDLVIVQENSDRTSAQLERLKLNVLEVQHGDLERMLAGIQSIGDRCGVPARAVKLVSEIRSRLAVIRGRTARRPRRSLVFVVGRSPGTLDNRTA